MRETEKSTLRALLLNEANKFYFNFYFNFNVTVHCAGEVYCIGRVNMQM